MMWQLSSREVAYLLWGGALTLWALSVATVRKSLLGVLSHLLFWKISLPVVLLAGYTYGLVHLLGRVGLWAPVQAKDTTVWFLFSGLVVTASAIERAKDENFWKETVAQQLKALVLVEWIVQTNTFTLGTELLLVPISVFLGLLKAVGDSREEFRAAARVVDALIATGALALVGFAVYSAIRSLGTLDVSYAIQSVVLPALLTVGILPAAFALAVFVTYENLFIRVGGWRPRRGLFGRYAALRVIAYCGFRPHTVHTFGKKYVIEIMNLQNRRDVADLLVKAKRKQPGEAELGELESHAS